LLAAMEELGMIEEVRTPAQVLIPYFDKTRLGDYLAIARQLRKAGLGVEVYPDPKKLGQQLKYADQRGFQVALVAGENEFAANECQVKNLATKDSITVSLGNDGQDLVAAINEILA
jgi:histidyl-tRNA synthetase